MDIILFETLNPSIKLLNFPATKFSTVHYFSSLFSDDRSIFFQVKNQTVNSILAISHHRMLQKNMRELDEIFKYLDKEAKFEEMDKGYL